MTNSSEPTWDLRSIPTADLLEMLHEYTQAHVQTGGPEFDHPNKSHYSTHFYNMRWAVAREIERRGIDSVLPMNYRALKKAVGAIAHLGPRCYGTFPSVFPVAGRLLKAVDLKSGERWITVHPHGDDEPGVPVLVRESGDGSGAAHIIGGAGGSLNFVKLSNLKSPQEYREKQKADSERKRAEEKLRREGMTPEQKELESAAKGNLDDRKRQARLDYVNTVYQAAGKEAPKLRTPEDIQKQTGVDMPAAKLAASRELRAHVAAAKAQVRLTREAVLNDHELAAEAGLGDITLGRTQDADLYGEGKLGMDLLQGQKPSESVGFAQHFGSRAREGGITSGQVKEEGKLVRERGHQQMSEKGEARAHELAQSVRAWNAQVKVLKEKGLVNNDILEDLKVPDPAQIMGILKAEKQLKEVEKEVKKQKGEVDKGLQVRPFIIGTRDVADAEVVRDFKDDASVRANRALLGQVDDEQGLTKYVRAGGYAVMNEAGQIAGGNEIVSRDVLDAFGSVGAAQIFAARLRQQMDDEEFQTTAEAMEQHHAKQSPLEVEQALKLSEELADQAKQIELETVENPVDLVVARSLNEKKLELLEESRKVLGDTYGRVAARGELALAMKMAKKKPSELKLDLGDTEKTTAINMARSFGLVPETSDAPTVEPDDPNFVDTKLIGGKRGGDYVIETGAGHTFITLRPTAVDKLAGNFDPEQKKRYDDSQAVKRGEQDEDGWMPHGIERRPSSTFEDPGYSLARFDNTVALHEQSTPEEMKQTLKDFVGAQVAEGQGPEDLRTDLYSPEFRATRIPEHLQPEFDAYRQELFPLAALTPEEKKLPFKQRQDLLQEKAKQIKADVEDRAREFSADYKKRHGMTDEDLVELHTQRIPVNLEQTPEAIHRTLAAMPAAKVAFTPLGKLDHEGRALLRAHFLENIAKIKQPSNKPQAQDDEGAGTEKAPQQAARQMNIFGELEDVDPEKEKQLAGGESAESKKSEESNPATEAWDGYVKALGGQQQAYETLQAIVRGEAMKAYAQHHGRVFGRPLKVGTERLPNWEKHLVGRLPEEKLKQALGSKYQEAQKLMAQLASRVGGKFAKEQGEGARREAVEKLKTMMKESQFGLFLTDELPAVDRPTIGRDAEKRLGSVWGKVADNIGKKQGEVNLIKDLTMSGEKVKQQRAVKLAVQNRRLGLHLGAGSGKSIISIGAFTELHHQGKAKKAIFAVPSAVQAQFGGEMLRFTTPGAYKWLADPTAGREDRFRAYSDPDTHMVVVTHQALRDDIIHAVSGYLDANVAEHKGITPEGAAEWFKGQDEKTQKFVVRRAIEHHGWKPDMLAVDEAHGLLDRAGKPDSSMSQAIEALSSHMPTYLSMTGTPIKNDPSEAFSVLHKIDPERYPKEKRDEFLRKYGANTPTAKSALQREMAPYVYADRIASGVNRNTELKTVPLSDPQKTEYDNVMKAFNKVRTTRRSGADVEATRFLAPEAFSGQPESRHAAIADEVARHGLGGRLQHRLNKVVNGFDYPHNAKVQQLKADLQAHRDKPHVIFAHNYDSVEHIQRACKDLGLKVALVSGRRTGAEKAAAREGFQSGKYDVMLNTDAGSTGQNLQRGSVLINFDTPDTAMTHEQRIARIDRIGQQNDVTVRDYTTDTPYERRARKRLDTKYGLADVFQSPSELLDDSGLAKEIQSARARRRNESMKETF